jgi:tRNA C32,U32 (ribose-2'-O)-methylase TrmJ
VHPLAEAANLMRAEVAGNSNRIALLFGSEKTGLSNEELSHCRWLLTIPMQEYADLRHASMNLGQAVAVCLYELVRGHHESIAPTATGVKSAELEQLTVLLGEVLEESEYTRKHPANCDVASLRRLVQKMGLDAGTAPVWLGVMRQILWKLRGRK